MLTSLRYRDIYQIQKFLKSYSTNSPPFLRVLLCSAARVKMMLSMFHCSLYHVINILRVKNYLSATEKV